MQTHRLILKTKVVETRNVYVQKYRNTSAKLEKDTLQVEPTEQQ